MKKYDTSTGLISEKESEARIIETIRKWDEESDLAFDEYAARHAQCSDDKDPEIASEFVFTLIEGRLHIDFFGYGYWGKDGVFPEQRSFPPLTKEATAKLIQYLKFAQDKTH